MLSESDIRTALGSIKDPEIPTCSITDLGIVHEIRLTEGSLEIDLLPTFAGCPALDVIREDVEALVNGLAPDLEISVRFITSTAWTTDRIAPAAQEGLISFGIAPPALIQIGKPEPIACPYCGSTETTEESAFGPTPCRTVRYCASCRNPFEGFKRKGA